MAEMQMQPFENYQAIESPNVETQCIYQQKRDEDSAQKHETKPKRVGNRVKGYSDIQGLKMKIRGNRRKHLNNFYSVLSKIETEFLKMHNKKSRTSNMESRKRRK